MDFTQWMHRFVVVQVVVGELRVPVWGIVVGQTAKAACIQIDSGCIDIEKPLIKGVVEVEPQESSSLWSLFYDD